MAARKSPQIARAERYLCEHLAPVLRLLLEQGHRVSWVLVGDWESRRLYEPDGPDVAIRTVEAVMKTGLSYRELKGAVGWPKCVKYGSNQYARHGMLGRSLYCSQCIQLLVWPLAEGTPTYP